MPHSPVVNLVKYTAASVSHSGLREQSSLWAKKHSQSWDLVLVSSDNLFLLSLQLLSHLFLFTTGLIPSSQDIIAQKIKMNFLRLVKQHESSMK